MKITDTNAIKVCELKINDNKSDRRLWDINWILKDKNLLSQNNGRCYFIVVDDEIFKIGYSDQLGGIKSTIETYKSSGNSGRPSDRTHGIHILIAEELLNGKKVEFYFQHNENINVDITLMDGSKTSITTSVSGKSLENENMKFFLNKEGNHPNWNFQEAGIPWAKHLQDSRIDCCNKKYVTIEQVKERLGLS